MKSKIIFLSFIFYCLNVFNQYATAQIVKSESFDGTQFLPFGWTSTQVNGTDINNFAERVTAGTSPACTPHSGTAMIRYRSGFMFNAGEQYFIASPKFDLTNNPGTATVSFWMYRDNLNSIKDSIGIYVNDSAAANRSRGSMSYIYSRSRDTVGFNGWKQYTAVIPSGYTTTSAYIIFVFTNNETTGLGANMYLDDFSIQTYPKASVLISSTLFYQETADVSKGLTDNLVIGIKVSVDGAGDESTNSFRIDSIVTNATGTTALSDVVSSSAKIWYTKGTNSFITNMGNQFGSALTPTYFRDKFAPASTFYLENGDNYFWVTYGTSAGAVSGNFIDADFNGVFYRRPGYTGSDTSRAPLVSTMAGARQIDVSLCNGVIPLLINGTGSWWIETNDNFINRVYLRGQNSITPSYPFLDNNINDIGPPYAPWFSGPAPFSSHPPDYQQFSQNASGLHPNITAVLTQGTNYTAPVIQSGNPSGNGIALQCGTWTSSNYMAAWIDFNKDGDLLDPQELIIQSGPMNANSWVTTSINVPVAIGSSTSNIGTAAPLAGIVYGNVKMRVREVFATPNIQPCQSGGYTYGETEDYVLSIVPPCIIGTKLWLGYTDDWNSSSNWCGGLPGINDIAIIDEVGFLGGSQNGAPFDPVIHSGTLAQAKTIRLSATDTLTINATSGSSLQIADSLSISYNTPAGGGGKVIINSAFADSARLASGSLAFTLTPFMGTRRNCRSQLVYTKNELKSFGLSSGDVIDQLVFYFRATPGTAVPFGNLSIKYATVDSTWNKWPQPPTALAPATSAYVTVFSNASYSIFLPPSGGSVAINLLPNTFIWNGSSDIVLEICYDRGPVATAPSDDLLYQSQTTGANQFLRINNANSTPTGCALTFPVTLPAVALVTAYRPNITFMFHRPYAKFPINITGNSSTTPGNWINNGSFIAGNSSVTFNNNDANQVIGGISNTTFNELVVNKSGAPGTNGVSLGSNINVDSFLVLTNGYIDLNQKILSVNNSALNSISRTNGWIRSENYPQGYGRLQKKIGTITGSHLFPFSTSGAVAGTYIPFTVNLGSGDLGNVTISTYSTAANNTPYPDNGTTAGTVTHVNDLATGLDLSVQNAADRFWQIDKTGPSGVAALTFSITTPERPTQAGVLSNSLKPQIWENPTSTGNQGWKVFPNAFTHSPVTNAITLNTVTQFTGAWVVSNVMQPLSDSLILCNVALPSQVIPSGPSSVCIGSAIVLNATSAGNTIDWYTIPVGGVSIGSSPSGLDFSHSPTVNTTYYAEARDANGCLSLTRTPTGVVTVDPMPGTSITPSGPTTMCTGSSVNLTANGTGTVLWSTGDTNSVINVNTSGIYTAFRITANNCSDSAQVSITVNPLPPVSITASKTSICKNEVISLTGNGALSYSWTPSTGLSATTGSSVSAQPLVTTTYSLSGTAATGCVKTVTKKITVKNLPTLSVSPASITICPGDAVVITAGGNGSSFAWSPASGLSATTGSAVTATPTSSTIYSVTATGSNSCTITKTSSVTVTCKTATNLISSNITGSSADLSWTGQSCATGYKLQYRIVGNTAWTTININSNTASHVLTGLLLSTSYDWRIATKCSTNVFAAFSGKKTFTTASVKLDNEPTVSVIDLLSVYPNPTHENINIELFSEKDGNGILELFNSLGQLVYSRNIVINNGSFTDQVNTTDYATGLYLIRINCNDNVKAAKFLKE